MEFGTVWKYYFTQSLLKAAVRKPSEFNIAPNVLRPVVNRLCRLLPHNNNVQIRPLRLAGIRAEEIKPPSAATQLIFHIHGGAFFFRWIAYSPRFNDRHCSTVTNASDSY